MAETSSPPQFVHLHLHSEYSLLDGANRISKLVARVKDLGMDAVALTDHGNLHGAVDFYREAKDAGIKPILGIEAYVAPDLNGTASDRTNREHTGVADGGFHLVLLAENETGWRNLLKLSSDAYLRGFYYKPRMDKTTLAQWGEGLIAINGHLGSSLAFYMRQFVNGDKSAWDRAVAEARWHARTFPANPDGEPRFFIELQHHETDQNAINPHLIRLARELELPLICDNDSHFLGRDDHEAHDALICVSMQKTVDDQSRLKYSTELYVKSPQEMRELFAAYENAGEEALANTRRVADRCNVDLDFTANHAPVVKIVSDYEHLPADADGAVELIRQFDCEHPVGSSEWYRAFCAQFELKPYDAEQDDESQEQIKAQCDGALRMLTEAGAIWRYGPDRITDEIRARIDRELQILADKLISAYFVIVWDFVNYARGRGIPSNARGSGVGTMVGYCLGLSNACPVKYGLLFERFTDPDRTEYPDIDIDICQDGRAEVIDYVRRKYGHVAQIITFGTLKAKAVIRDVGRVLDIPLNEVNRIAKLIPNELKMTLGKALEKEPELQREYRSNPTTKRLIDIGQRLEGMKRHASVHAAGVVMATQPLENIVPLYKQSSAEDVITQWDGPTCEKVGLLKMDFLGLRTLSIIQRCRDLIEATLDQQTQLDTIRGACGAGPAPDTPREFGLTRKEEPRAEGAEKPRAEKDGKPRAEEPANAGDEAPDTDPLDLERLRYCDQNVFDLFRRGDTEGVFQFESTGMRGTLVAMGPDRLEDLIAANALYRPGPMANIPHYNDRKHGRAPVDKVHPIIDRITAETHGILVYQEQVMLVCNELGGIPLRGAYTLIKAISKKKEDVIASYREKFLEGAQRNGLAKARAEEIFELIRQFADYGFNKSHSTGYAIVAYQTAYLKTYFPVQYMAALLTYESVNTDKVNEYMDECRRVMFPDGHAGIDVRPPDINKAFADFTVVFEDNEPRDPNHGHIRFGLGAVKGVGQKAIEAIIDARESGGEFRSIFDFCERVPPGIVNRSCIEALIKCGAFDSVHGRDKRSALVAALDTAISRGQQEATLRGADDFLFGGVAEEQVANGEHAEAEPDLPDVPPWDEQEMLTQEKGVLGFYVSSHPVDRYQRLIDRLSNVAVREVRQLRADVEVTVGGMIGKVRPTLTRRDQRRMAFVTFEDRTGSLECVAFPETFARYSHLLQPDEVVFLKGKVNRGKEEVNIAIDEVIPVAESADQLTRAVRIVLREGGNGRVKKINGELKSLNRILRQQPGNAEVFFEIHQNGMVVLLRGPQSLRVAPSGLPSQLAGLFHDQRCCKLMGPTKLIASDPSVVLQESEPTTVNRIREEDDGDDNETCDSIDRY